MIKTKLIALGMLIWGLFYSINTSAQDKVNFIFDYHYNLGVTQKYWGETYHRGEHKMGGNSLQLYALYNMNQLLSAGAGIGLEHYNKPNSTAIPLFVTGRVRPLEYYKEAYVYSNLGYSFFSRSGWLWSLGLGYTWNVSEFFGLNFQFGYQLNQFRKMNINDFGYDIDTPKSIKKNLVRNSLSFGIGLVF